MSYTPTNCGVGSPSSSVRCPELHYTERDTHLCLGSCSCQDGKSTAAAASCQISTDCFESARVVSVDYKCNKQ